MAIHKMRQTSEEIESRAQMARSLLDEIFARNSSHSADQLHRALPLCQDLMAWNPALSENYLLRIQAAAGDIHDKHLHAELCVARAELAKYRKDFATALQALSEAQLLYHRVRDRKRETIVQEDQGLLFMRLGRFVEAQAVYRRVRRSWTALRQPGNCVTALVNIAIIYIKQGDLHRSLGSLLNALELAETNPPADEKDHARLMSTLYNTLGGIHKEAGNLAKAEEYCRKTIPYYSRLGMHYLALTNLAIIHLERKQYYRGAILFKKALASNRESGYPGETGNILVNLGELYLRTGKRGIARSHIHQALQWARQEQKNNILLMALEKLSRLELECEHYNDALSALQEALPLAQQQGALHQEQIVHERMSRVLEVGQQPQKALYHAKAALQCLKQRSDRQQFWSAAFEWNRKLLEQHELTQCRNRKTIRSLETELQHHRMALHENVVALARKDALIARLQERLSSSQCDEHNDVEAIQRLLIESGHSVAGENNAAGPPGSSIPVTESDLRSRASWQALLPPAFQEELLRRYPGLSNAEVKVCSLIKVGLNPQDCADTLLLSYRTIETHRRNIRKKMKLGRHGNIDRLIRAI